MNLGEPHGQVGASTLPDALPGGHHCVTCGDDGAPMRILRVDEHRALALCEDEDDGTHCTVEIALVDPVAPGDRVLVHAGTALTRLEATIS